MFEVPSSETGALLRRWCRAAAAAGVAVATAGTGITATAAKDAPAAITDASVSGPDTLIGHEASDPRYVRNAEACSVPGLADDASTVRDGHFDYGVQVVRGKLWSRIKDDRTNPPVWRAPNKLLFALGAPARKQVPDGNAHSFLGEPGDPVWTIGQTQQSGVPWLGWNTQHSSAVQRIDGPTRWRLDSVIGPGKLFIYQYGPFGGVKKLLGLSNGFPRRLKIPHNIHAHGNWSFTKRGVYRVRTTHTAELRSGTTVSSKGTLYVQVGPCPKSQRTTNEVPAAKRVTGSAQPAGNRARSHESPPHA